jgi:hypothetical protein
MPVFETFAKRQKKLRGDSPDVYTYDSIPKPLRVQIVHIMHETLGDEQDYIGRSYGSNVVQAYEIIVAIFRKELGVFVLPHAQRQTSYQYLHELKNYMLNIEDAEHFMSVVELVCRVIERTASKPGYRGQGQAAKAAQDAIEEINTRFKEHGVGYEYVSGEIFRIDDELVHTEAVKPALAVLRNPRFKGAEDEFLKAYEDYRKGNNKGALTEALKAFESTIKIICEKRGWVYQPADSAKNLLNICFKNGLIPSFYESHFAGLRAVLEAAIPTPRNKLGGHGQGSELTTVPDHLASYVLHMTASTILFLVKSDDALADVT